MKLLTTLLVILVSFPLAANVRYIMVCSEDIENEITSLQGPRYYQSFEIESIKWGKILSSELEQTIIWDSQDFGLFISSAFNHDGTKCIVVDSGDLAQNARNGQDMRFINHKAIQRAL